MNLFIKKTCLFLIKAYQFGISPFIGPVCRFYPSCSDYTYQAIARYGLGKGVWFAVKRVVRCHPFHPGGVDPVPTPPIQRER